MDTARAGERDTLAIEASNGAVTVAEARVVMAGIEASNGIIHVIDTVMLPPTR